MCRSARALTVFPLMVKVTVTVCRDLDLDGGLEDVAAVRFAIGAVGMEDWEAAVRFAIGAVGMEDWEGSRSRWSIVW